MLFVGVSLHSLTCTCANVVCATLCGFMLLHSGLYLDPSYMWDVSFVCVHHFFFFFSVFNFDLFLTIYTKKWFTELQVLQFSMKQITCFCMNT